MSGTTNRVALEEAADLLTKPPRACIGYVVNGEPRVEPATVRYEDSRFCVQTSVGLPNDLEEVVLVIDEGIYFFDLRAIYVRGTPRPVAAPTMSEGTRFELEAAKVTCWDYGRLRATRG